MSEIDVIIVDDEPVAVRRLARLLRQSEGVRLVGTAANGNEALALVRSERPDLVLLDIEMPGSSGLMIAEELSSYKDPPSVIFVTAFSRFALDAFNVDAADYLLKPVETPRLEAALTRVRAARSQRRQNERIGELEALVSRLRELERSNAFEEECLWAPSGSGQDSVRIADIIWLQSERDYVRIHTARKSYFMRASLREFEQRLEQRGIVRVHRSAMVRLSAIRRIEPDGNRGHLLLLSNGAPVRSSRRFGKLIKRMTASSILLNHDEGGTDERRPTL